MEIRMIPEQFRKYIQVKKTNLNQTVIVLENKVIVYCIYIPELNLIHTLTMLVGSDSDRNVIVVLGTDNLSKAGLEQLLVKYASMTEHEVSKHLNEEVPVW